MDLTLTPAQTAFRDELRSWLAAHLVGEFRNVRGRGGPDDDDAWDVRRAWDRELGAGGWIGITWPREYGGRGLGLSEEVVLMWELACAGAPARGGFHGETLLAPTVLSHGTEQQKRTILPGLARGEVVWCQGYSEPGAGSDLAAIATRGRLEAGEWVIDGQKIWTTFAHHAEWMFAIVRTEAGSSRHAGLSYLLVPLDQTGVSVRPIRTMLGDSGFNEVFLDGARTAADQVVGAVGNGWRVAMSTLGHERATSVLGYQFSFERELADLFDLARASGKAADPLVRQELAQVWMGLRIMSFNNLRTLTGALRNGEFGPEASIGKHYWSTWHKHFTEVAMSVAGARAQLVAADPAGGTLDPVEGLRRAYLRARAESIYAGTSEIQRNIIAERVLGLPKEPRR